jgi:putative transposase
MAYYKRNLPHFQPGGYAFFITFRLHGTLPGNVVNRLKAIKTEKLKKIAGYDNSNIKSEKFSELQRKYFKQYDDYLDNALSGPKWLKDPQIAQIVKEAILFCDEKEYNLIAFTIMPNHVHMVFIPIVKRDLSRSPAAASSDINIALQYPVTDILRKLKGSTSRECNKLLNRSGSFWQHESYDHVIRNSDSLKRIVNYILNNPVKAGLADSAEEWKFSYINHNLIPEL